MGFNTDVLFTPDEIDILCAEFIRKGMRSDKALEKARMIVRERKKQSNNPKADK